MAKSSSSGPWDGDWAAKALLEHQRLAAEVERLTADRDRWRSEAERLANERSRSCPPPRDTREILIDEEKQAFADRIVKTTRELDEANHKLAMAIADQARLERALQAAEKERDRHAADAQAQDKRADGLAAKLAEDRSAERAADEARRRSEAEEAAKMAELATRRRIAAWTALGALVAAILSAAVTLTVASLKTSSLLYVGPDRVALVEWWR